MTATPLQSVTPLSTASRDASTYEVILRRRYGPPAQPKCAVVHMGFVENFHEQALYMHVHLTAFPVLGPDSRLIIQAGTNGETFPLMDDRLPALHAIGDSDSWPVIGAAFRGRSGQTYHLALDAVPPDGHIVLSSPRVQYAALEDMIKTSVPVVRAPKREEIPPF